MNYYRTGWKVRSGAAVVQWKPFTRVSSFFQPAGRGQISWDQHLRRQGPRPVQGLHVHRRGSSCRVSARRDHPEVSLLSFN